MNRISLGKENFDLHIYLYLEHVQIQISTNERASKLKLSNPGNVKYHLCDLKYLGRTFHGC